MAIENKASFYLKDFEISKFTFNKVGDSNKDNVSIKFTPKGAFSNQNKIFSLTIDFRFYDVKTSDDFFTATITGFFGFENVQTKAEIPSFFYKNSIAILYPYLRSFVSSVTLQANIGSLILPTMNLSSLEPELINATKEVD